MFGTHRVKSVTTAIVTLAGTIALVVSAQSAAAVGDADRAEPPVATPSAGPPEVVAAAAKQQTKLTGQLNKKLKAGSSGVLLRAIPDNPGTPYVPASWTRNDIKAPNPMYLVQNPFCGPRAQDTPFQVYTPAGPDDDGAFVRAVCGKDRKQSTGVKAWTNTFAMAQAGLVSTKVNKFTAKTFYPTDSNASDSRAAYTGMDGSGNPKYSYPSGSYGHIKGGAGYAQGRGCHADGDQINQTDARIPGTDSSLVSWYDCRCEMTLSGNNWQPWVDQWLSYASDSPNHPPFFFGNDSSVAFNVNLTGKAPMWALDWASCWVSDRNDLVSLQNALWYNRARWWNGMVPLPPQSAWNAGPMNKTTQSFYWGWNEVPVKKSIDKPKNWTAILVRLPAGKQKIQKLDSYAKKQLTKDLNTIVRRFQIPVGSKSRASVVVLTEKLTGTQEWQRQFKCQDYRFGKHLAIRFQKQTKKNGGYCYLAK